MNSKEINKFVLAVLFYFFILNSALPQVAINTNGAQPNSKSIIDISSTTLGALLPRMTKVQREAISTPPQGLLVFQTDGTDPGLYYATGSGNNWSLIFNSANEGITGIGINNYMPYWTASNTVSNSGLYWDALNSNLGLGTSTPAEKMQIVGNLLLGANGTDGILKLYSEIGGTDYILSIQPSSTMGASFTLTMPPNDGDANQVLKTDGSGVLSWTSTSSGTVTSVGLSGGTTGLTVSSSPITTSGTMTLAGTLAVANGGTGTTTFTAGRVIFGNGTSALATSANLFWDNTNNRLGINDASPSYALDVAGDINVTGSFRVNGTDISSSFTVPTGVINQYAGSTAPSGYLVCDGSAVSRTTYASLYAVIGITYGAGDGSTTFNVPNLKGKVPVGRNSADTQFDVLGETGGEKTHTITTSEMPAHSHSIDPPSTSSSSDGSHTHSYTDYYSNNTLSDNANDRDVGSTQTSRTGTTVANGAHTHTLDIASFTSGTAGSGTAMNVLQPYIVLNYIIKT